MLPTDFTTPAVNALVGGLIVAAIGFVGFLVRHYLKSIDDHLGRQDLHLSRQDGKLDSLGLKGSEHDRALAVLDIRVSHLEAAEAVRRAEHEQFAGFLQVMGFKRSEAVK